MYAIPENITRPEGLLFYYNDITNSLFSVGILIILFVILTSIFSKLSNSIIRSLAMSSFFCSILAWLGYLVTYSGSNLIPSSVAIIFTIITTISTVLAVKSNDWSVNTYLYIS